MQDVVGIFVLIHRDNPSRKVRAERIASIQDGSFWTDDCPICRAQKLAGGDIYFDAEKEPRYYTVSAWSENGGDGVDDTFATLREAKARALACFVQAPWFDAEPWEESVTEITVKRHGGSLPEGESKVSFSMTRDEWIAAGRPRH
jgi:hypothetical protein